MNASEGTDDLTPVQAELLDLAGRLWPQQGPSCPECGRFDWSLAWRFRVAPIGTFSLAGQQMKLSARRVIIATCRPCGHELLVQLTPTA